jgi:hypothetical protein
VRDGAGEEQFLADVADERAQESRDPEVVELAMPLWQSYAGIRRYLDKRATA